MNVYRVNIQYPSIHPSIPPYPVPLVSRRFIRKLQGKAPGTMERSSQKDSVKFNPFANKLLQDSITQKEMIAKLERNRLLNNRLTRSSSPLPTEINPSTYSSQFRKARTATTYWLTYLLPPFLCIFLLDKRNEFTKRRTLPTGIAERDALVESRHPPPHHQFIVIEQNSPYNLYIAPLRHLLAQGAEIEEEWRRNTDQNSSRRWRVHSQLRTCLYVFLFGGSKVGHHFDSRAGNLGERLAD